MHAARSTMRAISPRMRKRGATAASGSPSITTCPASPAPRPRSSSAISRPARSTIRVGAGGIMLPNHAPLIIAEQFGTLARLFPGRIDLGLGRAPGTDQLTVRALRRDACRMPTTFRRTCSSCRRFFAPVRPGPAHAGRAGGGHRRAAVDPRIQHLRRAARRRARPALRLRLAFRAGRAAAGARDLSQPLQAVGAAGRPYAMVGVNVIAADTDARGADGWRRRSRCRSPICSAASAA